MIAVHNNVLNTRGYVYLFEVEISIFKTASRRRCPSTFFSRQLGAHQATAINAPETIEPEQRAPRFAPERLPIQLARDFQPRSCECIPVHDDLSWEMCGHLPSKSNNNDIPYCIRTTVVGTFSQSRDFSIIILAVGSVGHSRHTKELTRWMPGKFCMFCLRRQLNFCLTMHIVVKYYIKWLNWTVKSSRKKR